MSKSDVKKFANKKFLKTVDMGLLKRFFHRYRDDIDLDLESLTPESVYDFLTTIDESCPAEMMEDLHKIVDLSSELGMDLLQQRAHASDPPVVLIPPEEKDDPEGGIHINPRYLALRAYLDHRDVFDSAHKWLAFFQTSSPGEFNGVDENVDVDLNDSGRDAFEKAASEYFNNRYKGNYCKISFFDDDDEINILVTHGKYPVTTVIVENEDEKPLTFREIRQDALSFNPKSGRLKAFASIQEEKTELSRIFATQILNKPDFFDHADSQNLYELDPLLDEDFHFEGSWDPEFVGAHIAEVQYGQDKRGGYAITVRDKNALALLRTTNLADDLKKRNLLYAKVQFEFRIRGKKRTKMVKIKPPGICSFKRETLEKKVMEHLRRNGFCTPRKSLG